MPPMSPCSCSLNELTAVRFAHDVALLRCQRHDEQLWTVEGRPASAARAHAVLRNLFEEGRTRHGARRTAPRRRVVQLAPLPAPATTADALTALLNARGVAGSWAVA